jgi:uncharacterized protein (DUF58 family)
MLPLTWTPTSHYRRLATAASLPLLAAVALGHPGYLVLAAPMVAALALAARCPGYGLSVTAGASRDRCFEGEDIIVRVRADPGGPAASVGAQIVLPPALMITAGSPFCAHGAGGPLEMTWHITARRWGRWQSGQLRVTVRSRGGLFAGTASIGLPAFTVFPHPPPLDTLALPAELHTRIGDHVDRHPGDGIEFAGVRPFVPGDRLRRINWPVTSRRGALHVNQLATERAAEIVVVIDALTDAGPPGDSTLDRSVRGAAGIARAYTRAGDRVGVVTLYGPLRWLEPGTGQRQFFGIVESVLEIRSLYSEVPPDLSRIPPTALPPAALVVFFTPLLDDRAIEAAIDLRERGYAVIITDVLATTPTPTPGQIGQLALRVWRLERQALRYRLESLGIPVTGWPGQPPGETAPIREDYASLTPALARFARYRVRGGTR